MVVEKYFDKENGMVTVTTNTYAHGLDHIKMLEREIKTDFPGVDVESISLGVFGPPRKERMVALQFRSADAPDEYKRCPMRVLCDYYIL